MNPSSANHSYAAADILRYHAGAMTAQERHAIEKAALDDPFLADALDGYAHSQTAAADLALLKEKLAAKQARQTGKLLRLPQRWMRVAALFLVVAGAGWLILRTANKTPADLASQNKKEQQQTTDAPPAGRVNEASSNISQPSDTAVQATAAAPVPANGSATKIPANKPARQQRKTGEDDIASAPAQLPAPVPETNMAKEKDSAVAMADVAAVPQQRKAMAEQTERPRAAFLRNSTDSHENAGYNNRGNTKDTVRLNITMKPVKDADKNMDVVKLGARSRSAVRTEPTVEELEPAEGWERFNDYISGNLKEPETVRRKEGNSGEVELSFDLNENGTPVNIKVVRSLCAACDAEAIRLLKEGPKWKKNRRNKGRLSIKF